MILRHKQHINHTGYCTRLFLFIRFFLVCLQHLTVYRLISNWWEILLRKIAFLLERIFAYDRNDPALRNNMTE